MRTRDPKSGGRPAARRGGIALAALCAALAFPAPGEAGPLWTLRTETEIVFQRLTPLGSLLVATDNELCAVDPASGAVVWRRSDIKKLKECNYDEMADTPYGLVDFGAGAGGMARRIEVLDLQNGQTRWDSRDLPVNSSLGLFPAPHRNQVLLLGAPKRGGKPALVAADLETGKTNWSQDALFAKPLQLFEVPGGGRLAKRFTVEGNQPPIYDTESTAILWLTADGPVRIDLATGNRLWIAKRLKGKAPPALRNGYAPILLAEGALFVPFDHALVAIDARSGAPTWRKERRFGGRVAQMELTPQGLLVRGAPALDARGRVVGKPFIDLLDPLTGASRWKKPYQDLDDATPFAVREGRLRIAAGGKLLELELASGAARAVALVRFKGGEVPIALEVVEGGVLLSSSQNLMVISEDGKVKYHAFHGPPGSSGWARFASAAPAMATPVAAAQEAHHRAAARGRREPFPVTLRHPILSRRLEAGRGAEGHASMLIQMETDGHRGPALVKLEKASGRQAAVVLLGGRTPDYVIDPLEGRVFILTSGSEVACYAF